MKGILKAFFVVLLALPTFAQGESSVIEEPMGDLTLRQAVSLALTKNLELQAFSFAIRIREAQALQAGLSPNPHLDVEVENAAGSGGSGKFSGFGKSETTIQLSQLIELGGKRTHRIAAATLSKDLTKWDYETKRMDVLTKVSKAFTDVLSAQEQLTLMQELFHLAEKVNSTVSQRVQAGKVSPIEEIKVGVALSSTRIDMERAKIKLQTARIRLAAAWGNNKPKFKVCKGNLLMISSLPAMDSLSNVIASNPDLARWATEIAQRQAVVDREKSHSIPDLTLSGGYRRLEENNDNTIVFGVSIPLMFFNRNQGTVQASLDQLQKAELDQRAAVVRVHSALTEAYQSLKTAHSEVIILQAQVLPGAQKAFDAINEGYLFGKFGFLDVLDSQRTLFQAKTQYLNAFTRYHKAVADVERLIGKPLASFNLADGGLRR